MLKATSFMLAIALASTANAAGWRSLRIDASSDANFDQSVALLRDKLTRSRKHAFERALQDIWTQRTQDAAAEQREFTHEDFYAQLDGMGYEQVVRVLDPSGRQAKRYRAEFYYSQTPPYQPSQVRYYGNATPLKANGYYISHLP